MKTRKAYSQSSKASVNGRRRIMEFELHKGTKATENCIGKIPSNIWITGLQKIVFHGAAHRPRRTLSIK